MAWIYQPGYDTDSGTKPGEWVDTATGQTSRTMPASMQQQAGPAPVQNDPGLNQLYNQTASYQNLWNQSGGNFDQALAAGATPVEFGNWAVQNGLMSQQQLEANPIYQQARIRASDNRLGEFAGTFGTMVGLGALGAGAMGAFGAAPGAAGASGAAAGGAMMPAAVAESPAALAAMGLGEVSPGVFAGAGATGYLGGMSAGTPISSMMNPGFNSSTIPQQAQATSFGNPPPVNPNPAGPMQQLPDMALGQNVTPGPGAVDLTAPQPIASQGMGQGMPSGFENFQSAGGIENIPSTTQPQPYVTDVRPNPFDNVAPTTGNFGSPPASNAVSPATGGGAATGGAQPIMGGVNEMDYLRGALGGTGGAAAAGGAAAGRNGLIDLLTGGLSAGMGLYEMNQAKDMEGKVNQTLDAAQAAERPTYPYQQNWDMIDQYLRDPMSLLRNNPGYLASVDYLEKEAKRKMAQGGMNVSGNKDYYLSDTLGKNAQKWFTDAWTPIRDATAVTNPPDPSKLAQVNLSGLEAINNMKTNARQNLGGGLGNMLPSLFKFALG